MDGAVLEAALLLVADVREHLDHLGVGGQHLGGEPADASLPGHRADVFEERGGDAAALVCVLDEEGDLGLVGGGGGWAAVRADAVVADGADELLADGRREAHPVHVVVVREAVHVAVGEAGVGREEAVVLRLVGDLLVEADEPAGVLGGDGPDPGGTAVTEDDIGFPVGRVGRVRLYGHAHTLRPDRAGQRSRGAVGKPGRTGASWGSSFSGENKGFRPRVGPSIRGAVRDWSRQP